MSKAGLNILSESIAAEYGEYGITSNIVMPSFYVSDLNKDLKISNKKLMINTKASLIKKLPDISELLEFIRYLIVHGKSISGQNFVIDNRDFQKEGNSLQNSYSAWEKKNNE